jgi:hypothetical protein
LCPGPRPWHAAGVLPGWRMATFDPRLYGARWADNYDEWHKGLMDDEDAVAALADFAGRRP